MYCMGTNITYWTQHFVKVRWEVVIYETIPLKYGIINVNAAVNNPQICIIIIQHI